MTEAQKVKITLLAPFSDYSDEPEFEIEYKEGDTFKDLLDKLAQKMKPGFKNMLYNKNGELTEDVAILKDGENILAKDDKGFSHELAINEEYVFLTILEMG